MLWMRDAIHSLRPSMPPSVHQACAAHPGWLVKDGQAAQNSTDVLAVVAPEPAQARSAAGSRELCEAARTALQAACHTAHAAAADQLPVHCPGTPRADCTRFAAQWHLLDATQRSTGAIPVVQAGARVLVVRQRDLQPKELCLRRAGSQPAPHGHGHRMVNQAQQRVWAAAPRGS